MFYWLTLCICISPLVEEIMRHYRGEGHVSTLTLRGCEDSTDKDLNSVIQPPTSPPLPITANTPIVDALHHSSQYILALLLSLLHHSLEANINLLLIGMHELSIGWKICPIPIVLIFLKKPIVKVV